MQLREASRRYQKARRNELALTTRRITGDTLRMFLNHVGPDHNLETIRRGTIEDWLSSQHVGAGTLRSRLSIIRTFFGWCVSSELIKRDPTHGIKGPRNPVALPRELNTDEIGALISVLPDNRARLMVM